MQDKYMKVPHEVKNQRALARTSQIMKWINVVLRPPDRVYIPCLVHDTRLYQMDVKIAIISNELKRCKYKTCYVVKTSIHNIYVKSKDQTPEAE